MAKCGAFALIWGTTFNQDYLYLFDHIKALGFDGIEIPLIPSILNVLPVREMKKKAAETGLACVFCAGLDPNQDVASAEQAKRDRGIAHLKRCVDVVKEFDGDVLAGVIYGVWGGFSGKAPTQDELERSAASLQTVAEYAQGFQVDLAIEPVNRFEGYLLATAQDGLKYLKKVGRQNVGLHLDTFQMNIEEKNLPAAIKSAGKQLFHFHLCASHRGVPGDDHIDWPGVFGALQAIGYQRWITVESFYPEPSAEASAAKVWRKLAPGADEIAKGGLDLVRHYLP